MIMSAAPTADLAASAGSPSDGDRRPSASHRLMIVVVAVALIWPVWQITSAAVQLPLTTVLGACGIVAVLAVIVGALTATRERTLDALDGAVLVLGLMVLVGLACSQLYANPPDTTDEAAFIQYAAELVRRGVNPYGADLLPALEKFQVPIRYQTFTLDGITVGALSYPAFSVLVTAAFLPIADGMHASAIANVAALGLTAVLFHLLLPRRWRTLGTLVAVCLPSLLVPATIGLNAVLVVPAMVVVAHRWSATGRGGHLSRGDMVRAACLGLAAATNQLAWFLVPFLVTGMYLLRRGELSTGAALRLVSRYTAIAVAVFGLVNAAFIVRNPTAWIAGVTEPLTQSALPQGHAAIAAPLFLDLGGGNLALFTLSGAAVYGALWLAYVLHFRRLGPACFILPIIAFVFPARSLMVYFTVPLASWIMSLASVDRSDFARAHQLGVPVFLQQRLGDTRARTSVALAGLLPGAGLVAAGLLLPEPLQIMILKVNEAHDYHTIGVITARVTNISDRTLTPRFNTFADLNSRFWTVRSGPAELRPHTSAVYELAAPDQDSMPHLDGAFRLQALTSGPPTISSVRFVTQPYRAAFLPSTTGRTVRVGDELMVTVQLRDMWGGSMPAGGVRIGLEQSCFSEQGPRSCHAAINGSPADGNKVFALTGPEGTAVFRLRDAQHGGETISLRAWVDADTYTFGYSPALTVRWMP
jgi:uncharacterized membrane protein